MAEQQGLQNDLKLADLVDEELGTDSMSGAISAEATMPGTTMAQVSTLGHVSTQAVVASNTAAADEFHS